MFRLLGKVMGKAWPVFLILWPVAAVVLVCTTPDLNEVTREGMASELPGRFDSRIASQLLSAEFTEGLAPSVLLVMVTSARPLLDDDQHAVRDLFREIAEPGFAPPPEGFDALIKRTLNPYKQAFLASRLISPDRTTVMTAVTLNSTFVSTDTRRYVDSVLERLDTFRQTHPHLDCAITGSAGIGHDYGVAAMDSLDNTKVVTYLMVIGILIIIYRSPVTPIIPLTTIVLSLTIANRVMSLLGGGGMFITKLVPIFLMVILFGSGTDYCLFIIGRFREELARGRSRREAATIAVSHVGEAITASALTTIAGLCMMAFAEFEIFRTTGPAVGISLLVALLAALTFAPGMLILLGRWSFWPGKVQLINRQVGSGHFWMGLARRVTRRPGLILLLAFLAFVPFAFVGARVEPSYNLFKELPRDAPAVRGYDLINQKYPITSNAEQLVVAAVAKSGVNFRNPSDMAAIDNVTRRLEAEEDIVEVRSVVQPLGQPFSAVQKYIHGEQGRWVKLQALGVLSQSKPRYVSRDGCIARFDVVLKNEAFSPEAIARPPTLRSLVKQAFAEAGIDDVAVHIGGISAHMHDLSRLTQSDLRRLTIMVVAVLYVILSVLLRGGISPIYLLATMSLTFLATIGITHMVFVYGLGLAGLDWKVKYFLFVLLMAIGVDYNIYIMSRVREERRRRPAVPAVQRSIVFTGGVISSCGLIMAGTFGSLMASTLSAMKEIGLAMAIGVLIDTFIVRPLMVPSLWLLLERVKERLRGRRASDEPAEEEAD